MKLKNNKSELIDFETISYNKQLIYLDRRAQTSPQGHSFRYVGLRKDATKPEVWKDGAYRSTWIYSFLYNDKAGGFEITVDVNLNKTLTQSKLHNQD